MKIRMLCVDVCSHHLLSICRCSFDMNTHIDIFVQIYFCICAGGSHRKCALSHKVIMYINVNQYKYEYALSHKVKMYQKCALSHKLNMYIDMNMYENAYYHIRWICIKHELSHKVNVYIKVSTYYRIRWVCIQNHHCRTRWRCIQIHYRIRWICI